MTEFSRSIIRKLQGLWWDFAIFGRIIFQCVFLLFSQFI